MMRAPITWKDAPPALQSEVEGLGWDRAWQRAALSLAPGSALALGAWWWLLATQGAECVQKWLVAHVFHRVGSAFVRDVECATAQSFSRVWESLGRCALSPGPQTARVVGEDLRASVFPSNFAWFEERIRLAIEAVEQVGSADIAQAAQAAEQVLLLGDVFGWPYPFWRRLLASTWPVPPAPYRSVPELLRCKRAPALRRWWSQHLYRGPDWLWESLVLGANGAPASFLIKPLPFLVGQAWLGPWLLTRVIEPALEEGAGEGTFEGRVARVQAILQRKVAGASPPYSAQVRRYRALLSAAGGLHLPYSAHAWDHILWQAIDSLTPAQDMEMRRAVLHRWPHWPEALQSAAWSTWETA